MAAKKRQRKAAPMLSSTLQDLREQVQAAQRLLDNDEAEALVAALDAQIQDAEHGALVRAARAVLTMEWAAYKSHGLRETQESLRYGAQTQVILLDLIHKAYALGVKRGLNGGTGE